MSKRGKKQNKERRAAKAQGRSAVNTAKQRTTDTVSSSNMSDEELMTYAKKLGRPGARTSAAYRAVGMTDHELFVMRTLGIDYFNHLNDRVPDLLGITVDGGAEDFQVELMIRGDTGFTFRPLPPGSFGLEQSEGTFLGWANASAYAQHRFGGKRFRDIHD